jgi:Icc-related predicted phosphoesterase
VKCLVVADLHYSLPQFDWVANVAEKYDAVILAGDHLDLASHVDLRAQVVVVRQYLELIRSKTSVILCSGNHDLDLRDATGEKVANWISNTGVEGIVSDGQSIRLSDVLFTAVPWWDGPLKQQQIALQLHEDAGQRPETWIWIHHAPASESPTSWTGSKHWGDVELRNWIVEHQPDMVFSGHVHQSPFVTNGSWIDRIGKTWIFNVGQHSGAPPAHIIFDTARAEVFWSSAAGMQAVNMQVSLSRPIMNLNRPPGWVTYSDRAADQNQNQNPALSGKPGWQEHR